MSIYLYPRKYSVYRTLLFVICLCAAFGCAVRQKSSPRATVEDVHPVYLVAQGSSAAQIWQIAPDNGSSSVVYQVAKSAHRPVGVVFPPEEIEKLQSYLAEQSIPVNTTVRDLLPSPYISRMALSPTGEALVWIEGDTYCVDRSAFCFGVMRLTALDLNTEDAKVLLQIPLNADEGILHYDIFGGPTWSPDGQRVAVIHGIRGNPVEAWLIIVNTSTGQIQEIAGTVDSGAPLVWSPDSSTIAWDLSRWHTRSSGCAIRFCTFQIEECRDIELDGLWIWNWSMDWSPDGKQIAFVAEQKDSDVFSDDAKLGLHLLDTNTGLVQDIPVDINGVLENPRWSPDGQFLAVDYRSKVGNFFQSLLIIEPNSGRIVSQLPAQRAESFWVWGRDGHSILVLTGTGSLLLNTGRVGLEVKIFDVRDGSLQTIVLPDELTTKRISDLTW